MNILKKPYLKIGVAIAGVVLLAGAVWLVAYFRQAVKLEYQLTALKVGSPIEVMFSRPIQKQLRYSISPALDGNWRVTRTVLGITGLKFYPARALTPGSSYQVELSSIMPLLASPRTAITRKLQITVEKPPDIAAVTPNSKAVNVALDTQIAVKLISPNHNLRQLSLTSDAPLVSQAPTSADDTTFVWQLAKPLRQGTVYHLTLEDAKQTDDIKRVLMNTIFTSVAEPHITTATNRDHFYPGETITIGFDQDMKTVDSGFKFGFGGTGSWQDARTYVFTPTGLSPGNQYGYVIKKGSMSVFGGVTEADYAFSISPPGVVVVSGASPGGGNLATNSAVSFSFDQPVDHASAQGAFNISPNAAGNFSWSGNTMIFHPDGLGYQINYLATLATGVKGTYGLPSIRSFQTNFSTTYQIIKLGVPSYRQIYSLSCEAAALRMALSYRGVNVSDYDIVVHLNYNPRSRDQVNNVWDNPYQMFVGDVNGVQGMTGWGVYGPPIAAAAQSFGRSASYVSGISVNQIAQAIHDNNPVVLWGYSGVGVKLDSWSTLSGVVQAPRNEHARTIYGVAGSAASPVGFYIHDPAFGDLYWTTGQLQANMSFDGSQASQGVIVY